MIWHFREFGRTFFFVRETSILASLASLGKLIVFWATNHSPESFRHGCPFQECQLMVAKLIKEDIARHPSPHIHVFIYTIGHSRAQCNLV